MNSSSIVITNPIANENTQNKQKQHMMNCSVLSSWNKKLKPQDKTQTSSTLSSSLFRGEIGPLPTLSDSLWEPSLNCSLYQTQGHYPVYPLQDKQILSRQIHNYKANSQMSFYSGVSLGESIFFVGKDELGNTTHKQSSNSFYSMTNLSHQFNNCLKWDETQRKAETLSSYYLMPHQIQGVKGYFYSYPSYTQQSFFVSKNVPSIENTEISLGKKIARNTIIINNTHSDQVEKKKTKHKSQRQLLHNTAPVKPLPKSKIKNIFETYLLKSKESIQINDDIKDKDNSHKCLHNQICVWAYKTKKQLLAHHNKMDKECQKDTINWLKLISQVKKLLLDLKTKNTATEDVKTNKIKDKYNNLMKKLSMEEHVISICGEKFETQSKDSTVTSDIEMNEQKASYERF